MRKFTYACIRNSNAELSNIIWNVGGNFPNIYIEIGSLICHFRDVNTLVWRVKDVHDVTYFEGKYVQTNITERNIFTQLKLCMYKYYTGTIHIKICEYRITHTSIMNKSRKYLCQTEEGLNFKGGMKNSKVNTRMWVEKLLSVLASHFIGYCWNYSNFLYYKSFKIWWLNEMVFIWVGIRITRSFSVAQIIRWICYKIM